MRGRATSLLNFLTSVCVTCCEEGLQLGGITSNNWQVSSLPFLALSRVDHPIISCLWGYLSVEK